MTLSPSDLDRLESLARAATPEKLFEQLRALTRNWNNHEDIPRSQQLECRDIGRKLNAIGGKQLMTDAYYDAKATNNYVAVIQAYWDGIGDWQW